jgi:acetolactate decarboxylase
MASATLAAQGGRTEHGRGCVTTAVKAQGYAPSVAPIPVPGAAVTQFAVLDALLAGAYESGLRVSEACAVGDFGLGCVDHLGGEVVILDASAIECTLDGPPAVMRSDEILPFAIIC